MCMTTGVGFRCESLIYSSKSCAHSDIWLLKENVCTLVPATMVPSKGWVAHAVTLSDNDKCLFCLGRMLAFSPLCISSLPATISRLDKITIANQWGFEKVHILYS